MVDLSQHPEVVEAQTDLLGYVLWATPGYDQPGVTANVTKYLNKYRAAVVQALAEGEAGLDFEGAELAASGTVDGDEEWWAVYTTDLNAQHRAIVGALRQKLAAAEARVKELEGALKPFADLAGSGEGFCSPVTVGDRSWCNNHRATYNDVAAECDVVKANRILGGTP